VKHSVVTLESERNVEILLDEKRLADDGMIECVGRSVGFGNDRATPVRFSATSGLLSSRGLEWKSRRKVHYLLLGTTHCSIYSPKRLGVHNVSLPSNPSFHTRQLRLFYLGLGRCFNLKSA
jgi:hypothetical protein